MKKIFYLALMLLPAIAMVSCSDDNDLPNVDFNVNIENGTEADGTVYVVQGDTLIITGIDVINNEAGKKAAITSADYFWDGYYVGTTVEPPYGYEFAISDKVPTGKHQIGIQCPVFAVDKTLATAVIYMDVTVVATPEELPEHGSSQVHPQVSVKVAE